MIIRPNNDVALGTFEVAEFAADLQQVHDGRADATGYGNPVRFFNQTYITPGIQKLLVNTLRRLGGKGGDPVIQTKTGFGGGKTHSLIALYHLVKSSDALINPPPDSEEHQRTSEEIKGIMQEAEWHPTPDKPPCVAVLDGTFLATTDLTVIKETGDPLNTLWGVMAYQLGGQDAYEIVGEAAREGTAPGGGQLDQLLEHVGPCVILMDELVAYVRNAGEAQDNIYTFMQVLTQSVRRSNDATLVVTLPESAVLALAVGRMTDSSSNYAFWGNIVQAVIHVFSRQAIAIVWDFAEANIFSTSTQNWMGQVEWVAKVVERLPADANRGAVYQADASTTIHAQDGPVIVTDPPYYDNIGYADLSDFFYVWLRPLLRDVYPDLFAGILTPKEEEMIATRFRFDNPRQRFEELLDKTLKLIRERCSPEFPSSIFYAYKQQEEEREGRASTGWETMLSAIVSAGFQIVGTWPMRTEGSGRLNALATNALASSVVLVCRPRSDDAPTATRRQFFDSLAKELPTALDQLTQKGHIAPTDLAQAAIGPGMQIYSRYSCVETISGEPVSVREALVAINRAIADYDERQEGDLDSESRFCLDWLKQHGYEEGTYGDAETLARAKNVAIGKLQDVDGLLTAEGGRVKLLSLDAFSDNEQLTLSDTTAWEGCFRMAYHMNREAGEGIAGAASVGREMGSNVESVERLGRILYNHYDRKGDSQNAVIFNNLVTEWQRIRGGMTDDEQLNIPI